MKRIMITLAAAAFVLAAGPNASWASAHKSVHHKAVSKTKTLVENRDFPEPAKKVWAALTQAPLLSKWLMKTDFQPVVGRKYQFRAAWGSVDGKVLAVKVNKMLSYTWVSSGLKTVVTWTLTPTRKGTHVTMAQSGFPTNQPKYYDGAKEGWPMYLMGLGMVSGEKE